MNSIVYAGAATVIAVVVGGLAAFAVADTRGLARSSTAARAVPLGASAVMLGLGFLIAFDTAAARLPRRARGSFPSSRRSWRSPSSCGSSRRRCARSTRGSARRRRSWAPRPAGYGARSTCRSWRGALAVAAGFAFAISLGEFGATVFLARPDRPTLPVAIFRFLGRPGELNIAQAYALAVVLMAVTVVSVLLVERVRVRRGGWF